MERTDKSSLPQAQDQNIPASPSMPHILSTLIPRIIENLSKGTAQTVESIPVTFVCSFYKISKESQLHAWCLHVLATCPSSLAFPFSLRAEHFIGLVSLNMSLTFDLVLLS